MAGFGPVPSDDRLSSGSLAPTTTLTEGGESVNRIAFVCTAALVLVLAAGPAMASNTGFKLNYPIIGVETNYLSVPYFYFPDGDVNNPTQNAESLCNDLMTNATTPCTANIVGRLERVGVSAYAAQNHPCGTGIGMFDLTIGEMVFVKTSDNCTADIVGSHDDTYTDGKGSNMLTLLEGSNAVSVPYHVVAVNAEDLCVDINARYAPDGLGLVTRVDVGSGAAQSHPCGSGLFIFDITPGEGLFLTPVFAAGGPLDIQWTTY
jgi:hypothetical protein